METTFSFDYEHFDSLDTMTAKDKELLAEARKATERSYAPYSHFKVGAAARLGSGRIVTGSNQESEVFPSGICAERSLLYQYQADFASDPIVDFAVVSDPSPRECYPCGACRQVLIDTEKRQHQPIRIIMAGQASATAVKSAGDLLPFTFKL